MPVLNGLVDCIVAVYAVPGEVTIFSPAVKAEPEIILTSNVFGSVVVMSAIDLTTALVPDVEPVMILPAKLLI